MANVFLSYDRDDRSIAAKVAAGLVRAGHSVWWDRNIRGGAEFSQEIEVALAAADAVVVLWSSNAIASPWVRDEAAFGRDKARFIPARIDDCTPPLGFRQFHTIELLPGRGLAAKIAEVDRAIQALDREPQAGALATRSGLGRRLLSRRNALIGGGAAALVTTAGGFYFYRDTKGDSAPPPEIAPLLIQARQMMDQNTRDGQNQALGLYQRAVQLAPDYADAWGWLGYAYGILSHNRERSDSLAYRAKAVAAGRHALELDAKNQIGQLALAVALPFVGYWDEREQRLLQALKAGDNDNVVNIMAVSLQFVGRSAEALAYYQRIKHAPLTPAEYTNFIRALWSSNRLAELDQAIADAASLYATQGSLWFQRLEIATYGGLPRVVAALTDDPQGRPAGVSESDVASFKRLVAAIASGDPAEADAIVAEDRKDLTSSLPAEIAIKNASALKRLDDAFAIADALFFSRDFSIPDVPSSRAVSLEQRDTRFLFQPSTVNMRGDPRFELLVRDLGLDRYWRESGHSPDYRRAKS